MVAVVASEAFIASSDGWSLKGGRTALPSPTHSLLSAGAMFPKQSVHYFIKPRAQESSHATGYVRTAPARPRNPAPISAG